ncbi:MAG: hypothetical protein AAB131_04555 [Actinomycetota bacterium]
MSKRSHRSTDPWLVLPPIELLAVVTMAPPPQIPLAAISDLIVPVHDAAGRIVDWSLSVAALEHHDATSQQWAAATSRYGQWRRAWREHWPIGPITNVRSLLDEVGKIDHHLDRQLDELLDRILVADGADVEVPLDQTAAITAELETVRLALSVDDRFGTGVVDDMPMASRSTGLARAWAPPGEEFVLAATPATAVVIRPDVGMVLLHGGPEFDAFAAVVGVDMRADTVHVTNECGATLRLTQHEARPLGWIVPRSLRWHVRRVPIAAVWALTFDGLRSSLEESRRVGVATIVSGQIAPLI